VHHISDKCTALIIKSTAYLLSMRHCLIRVFSNHSQVHGDEGKKLVRGGKELLEQNKQNTVGSMKKESEK